MVEAILDSALDGRRPMALEPPRISIKKIARKYFTLVNVEARFPPIA